MESVLRAAGALVSVVTGLGLALLIPSWTSRSVTGAVIALALDVTLIALVAVGVYALAFSLASGGQSFPIWWEPLQVAAIFVPIGVLIGRVVAAFGRRRSSNL